MGSETKSIISDLDALHSQQTKQMQMELESQLSAERNTSKFSKNHIPPRFRNGLPPPPQPNGSTPSFGTLFAGKAGSVFGTAATGGVSAGAAGTGTESVDPNKSPLPPLHQNVTTEPVKRTIKDAWNGEWVSPENLKETATSTKKKKKPKVEPIPESKNTSSKIAVITVDTAMQKAMVLMGLRVLTTRADRRYGRGGDEPVQTMFRCFGCFTMEHDTTRTHCRVCGGMTFQRVSVYMDEDGRPHHRYFARDRFGGRYLEKNNLVPRGAQLVKYQGTGRNNPTGGPRNKRQQKRRKKRGFIQGSQQQNGYRGGGQRW